ncbi:hypothetical protein HAX54_006857 [Datura stramonium]|uniref:Uncharacterized protein n=1 Tax=Datura stramonium TaxID=4076 RepID=A0ABS8TC07_DATST|nr:hypothetical protein [Datura stramonium]
MAKLYEQSQNAQTKSTATRYSTPNQLVSKYKAPDPSGGAFQKNPMVPVRDPRPKPMLETLRGENLCYKFHEKYHPDHVCKAKILNALEGQQEEDPIDAEETNELIENWLGQLSMSAQLSTMDIAEIDESTFCATALPI